MSNFSLSPASTAVQAVIFDLDGVLISSEWMSFQIWREWAERHGGNLPEQAFHQISGTSAEETAAIVMQQSGLTFDVAESTGWVWAQMTERMPSETRPLPGAVELVETLVERGYPLAIASNAITPFIEAALTGLGMTECFPVRVSIDQVAEGKPAPDVYLEAARQLGAQPERCLAIEDSRVGVQSAAAAGMRVLAVPDTHDTRGGFEQAWRVCGSLEDALADLHSLLT